MVAVVWLGFNGASNTIQYIDILIYRYFGLRLVMFENDINPCIIVTFCSLHSHLLTQCKLSVAKDVVLAFVL